MRFATAWKKIGLSVLVTCSVLAAAIGEVAAATIRVERDGSGDYSTIQPALDAAADGDTVMIGPGEFTEYTTVRLPGFTADLDVFAYAAATNLTIIGAGSVESIIGPVVPMIDSQTGSAKGLAWSGSGSLAVSGLTFRNCYGGMYIPQGRIDVGDCCFDGNYFGIAWKMSRPGGSIVRSSFTSPFSWAMSVQLRGPGSNVLIQNLSIVRGGQLYFDSVTDVTVQNCDIRESLTGLVAYNGSNVAVRNSQVQGIGESQIYVYRATCSIDSCEIGGGEVAVNANYQSTVSVTASVLSGGSLTTVYMYYPDDLVINGSHILKGAGHAVYNAGPTVGPLLTRDLTNNYWGTSEPDSIAAWIWDRRDSPDSPGLINFEPFSGVAVPTEKKSLGSVKSMFR